MPTGASIIGGLNAGTNMAMLKQQQRRDAFDMQQKKLANYESIVGNAEKSLQRFQEEMAIKRAAATSPEGQKLVDEQYAELYKSVITPISRAGEKAFQQGIPVDTPVQLARLLPYQQLPDLNAQAVVAAQAAGGVKAAETQGALPGKKEFDTFQTDNDIRLKGAPAAATTQNINTRDMTVRTQGRLEEDFIGNDNRIQRLNTIRSQILENPEFLQFAGKLKSSILNKADKIGIPLTEGGKEFLVKQSQFIRDSIENINAYIKEITGAQMSEKEANRLRLAQPDPGEDVLSGDGPTKFIAKADGALKAATLAQARAAYFLEKGIVHDFSDPTREPPISLDGMKQVINDKGREQALIIKANNPDMPNDEVMEQAREIVQRRFGMIQ